MKIIPVGTSPCGVRQLIYWKTQITGILPELRAAGPIVFAELEPLFYADGLYQYGEIRKYLVLGDPAVPGGFITVRYLLSSIAGAPEDDWKCSLVVEDGTAESVEVQNGRVVVTLDTGVSTYASVYATLIADAMFTSLFVAILDGAGGINALAQAEQSFNNPPSTSVEATDGGAFQFGPSYVELLGIHVELGVGSIIDITVTDPDGVSHPRLLNDTVSGEDTYYTYPITLPTPILPNQRVIVAESTIGVPVGVPKSITLYAVTAQKR